MMARRCRSRNMPWAAAILAAVTLLLTLSFAPAEAAQRWNGLHNTTELLPPSPVAPGANISVTLATYWCFYSDFETCLTNSTVRVPKAFTSVQCNVSVCLPYKQ